jgi:hypothetical protein
MSTSVTQRIIIDASPVLSFLAHGHGRGFDPPKYTGELAASLARLMSFYRIDAQFADSQAGKRCMLLHSLMVRSMCSDVVADALE